jgi:signal transduction histidine kinase
MRSAQQARGAAGAWPRLALNTFWALLVLGGGRDLRDLASPAQLVTRPLELLIVASAAAAFLARRFPVPALTVAAVMDALPYWLPITGFGYHLSFGICLYTVTAHASRRWAAGAASAAFLVQVGLMADERGWQMADFFVVFVATSNLSAIALGIAARSRRATVAALQARAEEAERSRDSEARKRVAEERLRVARDLHDSVAHQIAVMNLQTSVASSALPDRPHDAQRALEVVHDAGRSVLTAIGSLLTALREEDEDLTREPSYDLDELEVLVAEFQILLPTLSSTVTRDAVPGACTVGAVTYLVVREGLTNAYKHADHAAPVELAVHLGGEHDTVRVHSTRRDAPASAPAPAGEGFGLRGMAERVSAVGGRLSVAQTDDHFSLSARVPRETGR